MRHTVFKCAVLGLLRFSHVHQPFLATTHPKPRDRLKTWRGEKPHLFSTPKYHRRRLTFLFAIQ